MLDNKVDIFAEMVSIFQAGLPDIRFIEARPYQSQEIPDDQFPAISIVEGGSRVIRELTSTIDIEMDVFVRLFTKGDDDMAVGRNLDDQLISLIEGNPQLNDTCISSGVMAGDPPIQWPIRNQIHIYDRILTVKYRRDIT